MSELRSIFSRPGAALGNLQYGLSPAYQTLRDPEKLPPHMRQTVAERLGVEGLWGGLLNTLSDPLTAVAVITSVILPLPTVANLQKLEQKFAGYAKTGKHGMSPFHPIQSGHSFFKNTPIGEVLDELMAADVNFKSKFANRAADLVNEYQKAKGRNWSKVDDVLLGAWLDGLHLGAPSGFKDKIRGALLKQGDWAKDKDFLRMAKGFRGVYDDVYKEIFLNPEARTSIKSALQKSHERALKDWKAVERERLLSEGMTGPEATQAIRQKLEKTLVPGSDEWTKWFDEKIAPRRKNYFNRVLSKRDPTGVNSKAFAEFLTAEDALRSGGEIQKYVDSALMGRMNQKYGMSGGKVPGFVMQRKGRMLPHSDDLAVLAEAGLLNERAYGDYQALIRKHNWGPETSGIVTSRDPIGMYTLGASQASATYIHEFGKLGAWTLKGHGQRLMSLYEQLDPMKPEHKALRKALEELYIPAVLGKTTKKAFERQAIWIDRIEGAARVFDSDMSKTLLGEKRAAALRDRVLNSAGTPILDPVTRRISNYLYTSTLGGNLSSAFRNMFQLVLTTGPVLGPQALGAGVASYTKRMGTFMDEMLKTKNSDKAFAKAFPEYMKAGIPGSVILDDSFYQLKEALEQGQMHGLRGKYWSPVRDALMFPFSLSEKSVRAITFEGARWKAMRELNSMDKGLLRKTLEPIEKIRGERVGSMGVGDAAIWLAGKTVQDTQFLSGPMNTPKGFMNLGPLIRQMSQFPSRYFEELTSAGPRRLRPEMWRNPFKGFELTQFEGGLGPKWAGYASYLSRAYLWSDLTSAAFMEIGKGMGLGEGIDMDQSLIPGALPSFKPGPLGVFPFQPPALSIAAGAISDVASGEFDETRYSLPLLMPGGVAGARAVGTIPTRGAQEVARFLNRRYVDYETPGPDGSYAVYNGKGSFQGYLQPSDIFLMGSGLLEKGSKIQSIQEMQQVLMKNRENIIQNKQQYIDALMRGNYDVMNQIDRNHQQFFGSSVRNLISENDIKRAQERRTIGGIEKVLDTIPTYLRPMYLQAMQTALEGNPDLLGVEPGAFNQWTGGTSHSRNTWRFRPTQYQGTPYPTQNRAQIMRTMRDGGAGVGAQGQGAGTNMGPFSRFNPYARSREGQAGDRSMQERQGMRPAFQSFTDLSTFGS